MATHLNGGLLRIARHRKGFPQGDAASRLGVPQVSLSRYENGISNPTEEFILRAASLYEVPASFLAQPDFVFGAPVSVHPLWRKKHDVTSRELDAIVAELNIRAMHLRRLLDAVDFAPKTNIPRLELDDYNGDVERIASLVRSHWMIPPGPFQNLTETVETAGAIVIHSALNGSAVSGVTVGVPGLPPIIVLNSDQPADRMRFTLAHELAHIVMHRFPCPNMEKEANEFASALLMPAADVRSALSGRIDLRRLAALKPEWRVSMQGLLYRAQSLGMIEKGEASWLWRQFSTLRIKLREPPELDFPQEKPGVMSRMLRLHLDNFGLTAGELALLLHVHEPLMNEYYDLRGSEPTSGLRLRVVR